MAQLNFDATQVAPSTGVPEALPAGWYNAAIDESEMKPTKDGTGVYLQLRFNVLDGQYAGRKVFSRLNLRNANAVAQEIAYKDLSAIAHAVGVLHVQDSQQLHGIPMKIKLKLKPADDRYDASNEIQQYRSINDDVGTVGAPAAAAALPPAAPGGWAAPAAPQPWQQPAVPVATPAAVAPAAAAPAAAAPAAAPWNAAPAAAAPAAAAAMPPWAAPQAS